MKQACVRRTQRSYCVSVIIQWCDSKRVCSSFIIITGKIKKRQRQRMCNTSDRCILVELIVSRSLNVKNKPGGNLSWDLKKNKQILLYTFNHAHLNIHREGNTVNSVVYFRSKNP